MDGFATPASGNAANPRAPLWRHLRLVLAVLGAVVLTLASVARLALPRATTTPSCSQPEIRIFKSESVLEHAKAMGITRPGGGIGIHGTDEKEAALSRFWIRFAHATDVARVWGPTEGCIGLTNEDVESLFDAVPAGTKVVISASR
jgi:hypothetical protein